MAAIPLAQLNKRWVVPAAAFLVAALVLLPQLGSYGLWDPQEITVADQARDVAKSGSLVALHAKQPPLTVWLIGTSTRIFGPTELAARLPLALLGILGALATYALGARLRCRRAGLFAAVVLVSSPLFLFQSRQLTSDVATVTASAIAMLGLAGLLWGDRPWLDGPLAILGLVMGHLSDGLLLGAFIPLAGAAVAAIATLWQEERRPRAAIALSAAAVVAFLWVFFSVFDVVSAQPGQLGVFGKTLLPAKHYVPLLGGQWRTGAAPANATFDYVINQVAFGMFFWSAVAPIAVLRLAMGKTSKGGALFLGWAVVGYFVTTLWVRYIGDVRFPALPAIALAVGFLLDDLLADENREGVPLAALFVLLAGFILALDIKNFPDELSSVHLAGRAVKTPAEAAPFAWGAMILGGAGALAIAAGLYIGGDNPRRRQLGRTALWASVGTGIAYGLYLSQVYTPALSQHFSYKNLFQSYFDHRRGDEPLAVMGIPGSGPEFYARGKLQRVEGIPQMLQFLSSAERAFAIAPVDRLCSIQHVSLKQNLPYYLLDDKNARFLFLTNKLEAGEKDKNPLPELFTKEAPASFSRATTDALVPGKKAASPKL